MRRHAAQQQPTRRALDQTSRNTARWNAPPCPVPEHGGSFTDPPPDALKKIGSTDIYAINAQAIFRTSRPAPGGGNMPNTLPFRVFGGAVILLCVGAGDLNAQIREKPAPTASSKPSTASEPRPLTDQENKNLSAVARKCEEIRRSANSANPPANPPAQPHRSHRPNIPKGVPDQYPKPPDYGELSKDPETYWQWLCGLLWR